VLTRQIVQDALQDAGLVPPLLDCGVAIGSSRGCQRDWEQIHAQPERWGEWPQYLLSSAAVTAAHLIQTQGPVSAPMNACATGLWAIAQGADWIRRGECDRVLVGGIEAPISPLTLASFHRMGALATTGCYPFDRDREGLALAEGGAVLVLETQAGAIARQAKIYGAIGGFGGTADAYHLSAPDPDRRVAAQAIHLSLERSGLRPTDIGYIHAHGTSTRLNDAQEAALIQTHFPVGLPVSSTKGATGHTLGASGALGVVFSLLAFRDKTLPRCVGVRSPDFEINLVRETVAIAPGKSALCLSFGFGGQNTALVISAPFDP
jgi:3-oxoacyl-[acyl-carrier-protein] synthase II